ncbi:methylmalonyl Co-A mutase-associated GTPase MeaB [Pseudohaliea rubra]|uniref:Putative periplasmic protein kinase ArgK n=1 Tax=Pseudohaliea rubra DSM 19751 TaxID=1265313 RepID=A0A095WWW7_9GAMM|nr:methylmalonyl Co-A mutase-associated GTPase MeaB [Pseudohaliea rubra]KGE03089.1 putative periplasmic protein kinase ArgK [Pseudohaliea rubra DSM 19751]
MAGPDAMAELVAEAVGGSRSALARLISVAERGGEGSAALEAALLPCRGESYSIGITGAPGAGKSTLASALTTELQTAGERVALLAVDPSSPLTRGAILGDRVRLQPHLGNPEVFIRSMASRGHLGGLAMATCTARRVLEACGWPLVLIETVGVGQAELDVAGATDTVLVVLNPGWGDEMQANKAGLMEIADIFVINKADRQGLEATRRDLEAAIAANAPTRRPAIVETVATEGTGLNALREAIADHRQQTTASGEHQRRRQARAVTELRDLARARLELALEAQLAGAAGKALADAVTRRETDVDSAARRLLATLFTRSDPEQAP